MGRGENLVEHTADIKFSTVMNAPSGQFVMGQLDPIIGQTPDFQNGTVVFKENLEWSAIISTTGSNDQIFRNVITGEVLKHSTIRWGTRWFINR